MKHSTALITLFLSLSVSLFAQKPGKDAEEVLVKPKMVLIQTEFGDMKVVLHEGTPLHRDNFVKLVEQGYYDSLLFHRVIKNFMIQGGDPLSKTADSVQALGMGDIGYTVPAEFVDSLFHRKGALCAARTENPEKASSGCQFYIVQGQVLTPEQLSMFELQQNIKFTDAQKMVYSKEGGTPMLDQKYTVFGQVIEGIDVIDKIAAVKTRPGDRPIQNVRMTMKMIDEDAKQVEIESKIKKKKEKKK